MRKTTYSANAKGSLSLCSMIHGLNKGVAPHAATRAAGYLGTESVAHAKDHVSLLITTVTKDSSPPANLELPSGSTESIRHLGSNVYSARVTLKTAKSWLASPAIERVQTKKRSQTCLDSATTNVGLRAATSGPRLVQETGKNVLIGIIDSGFDLSHPMFRDAHGALRVVGLLDQTKPNLIELTAAQLQSQWNGHGNPDGPGGDEHGHGTHVASIAGGSAFQGLEGVAPGAKFLLVKTNFIDTADAVKWVFDKAGAKPCVINMSLGHHWGAHDGTEVEEQLQATLVGKGKLIVVSAGNERGDRIHLGGRFVANQTETVGFEVLRQPGTGEPPFAVITLWYDADDQFDVDLITPTGDTLTVPALNKLDRFTGAQVDLEIGRQPHPGPTPAVKIQIQLAFRSPSVASNRLRNWRLRIRCRAATVGRIDAWFNNSGFAQFDDHLLVETARTIGLPATGPGAIAVASHVSKNAWSSDSGDESDAHVLPGRTSPFSSQGPTRDDRQKPEISAPGQYVTAALAENSGLSEISDRASSQQRLLTIEGTSMAAPMVTGCIALLLEKKSSLTPDKVRELLRQSARVDAHTGTVWNPSYGFGKIDIAKALSLI